MKSYERMKEQSEREKRDLEEIVAERYGVSAERMIIVSENICAGEEKYEASQ